MKKGRLFMAGLLAGLGVFSWGVLSHLVFGIGSLGVRSLPQEPAVLEALNENVKEPGFYIYPGGMEEVEKSPKEKREALRKRYEETYRARPHGILVLTPASGEFYSFPRLLLQELLSNMLCGLLAAWLLSLARGSLPSIVGRILFVATLGFFSVVAIDFSYWNWYDFPGKYLVSSLLDNTVGWTFGGVVLEILFRRER